RPGARSFDPVAWYLQHLDQRRLAAPCDGFVRVLPARPGRHRHQHRLDAPLGLEAEQRAAVVDQVELDVAPAPQALPVALVGPPGLVAVALGNRDPGLREHPADIADQSEQALEVGPLIVEEHTADTARLLAMAKEEVGIAVLLEPRIGAVLEAIAG